MSSIWRRSTPRVRACSQRFQGREDLRWPAFYEVTQHRITRDVERVNQAVYDQHALPIALRSWIVLHETLKRRPRVTPEQILVLKAGVIVTGREAPTAGGATEDSLGRLGIP